MIARVQEQLEAIYGIRLAHRAQDFVVSEEAARALGGTGRAEEELLVHEEDGNVEVALYFSPALLERLARFDDAPAEAFLDGQLGSYCELTEGISHFLYLVRSAEQERQVSLLELETQAEIDKFASCLLARWKDGIGWARELHRRLFDEVGFRSTLSEPERWRYVEANRLARAYCGAQLHHVAEGRMEHLLAELRHSYRLGAEAKLQYLANAA